MSLQKMESFQTCLNGLTKQFSKQRYDAEKQLYRIDHSPYCFPLEESPEALDCTFLWTNKVGYLISELRSPRCCVASTIGLQNRYWTKLGTFLATAIIDGVKTKIFTQYPSGFVYMERDDNGLPFRVLHNRLLHANKSPSQIQTNYNFVREEREIHPTILSVPSFCSNAIPCDSKTKESFNKMFPF
jgi:hypothetical protein